VVLLVDLDIFFELLSLGKSEDLSPVSQDFHSVEMRHLRFFLHFRLQLLPLQSDPSHFIMNVGHHSICVLYLDCEAFVFVVCMTFAFDVLSEYAHPILNLYI